MPHATLGRSLALRGTYGADRSAIAPSTLYFALLNGSPAASGIEPNSTGGYARVAKANDVTLWGTITAAATQIGNTGSAGDITWPTSTGLWSITAPLKWWAIYDNAAGGNLVAYGEMTTPIQITGAGDTARIPAGALTLIQEA